MIKTVWRALLVFWLVSVLIVISLPGEKFDGTPHWESIQWIPFAALSFHRDVVTETLANFLAFIPILSAFLSYAGPVFHRPHPQYRRCSTRRTVGTQA